MNIFETIHDASPRDEPYHSRFLVGALKESLQGDRSLFEGVWRLAAPEGWEPPTEAEITAEEPLGDGLQIDICMRCESPQRRVVGIEVKTVDASAKTGQLETYQASFARKFPYYDGQIAYLTPFNRERSGEAAGRLATVRVFETFAESSENNRPRHISWLDVADIDWDGNELWKQHQAYVRSHISDKDLLRRDPAKNRELADFFGEEQTKGFLEALSECGIQLTAGRTAINLADFEDDLPSLTSSLVRGLKCLLGSNNVSSHHDDKRDEFPNELRSQYLNSHYGEVHAALFGLAKRFGYVWIKGKDNYGVRTAYRSKPDGVSLVTSRGVDCLIFVLER